MTMMDTCVPHLPIPVGSHVACKSQMGIPAWMHVLSTGECAAFYCSGSHVLVAMISMINTNVALVSLV